MSAATAWAVEVNEAAALVTGWGDEWWLTFRAAHERTGRIRSIRAGFPGDRVEVACDDEEHARWLAEHMVAYGGLPKSVVKARRVLTSAPAEAGAA